MDIEKFLHRPGLSARELGESLQMDPSNFSNWKKGKSKPSYSVCLKLIEMGMTISELFGDEVWSKIKQRSLPVGDTDLGSLPDDACKQLVERGLKLIFVEKLL